MVACCGAVVYCRRCRTTKDTRESYRQAPYALDAKSSTTIDVKSDASFSNTLTLSKNGHGGESEGSGNAYPTYSPHSEGGGSELDSNDIRAEQELISQLAQRRVESLSGTPQTSARSETVERTLERIRDLRV